MGVNMKKRVGEKDERTIENKEIGKKKYSCK
jgi:hypothetical protein